MIGRADPRRVYYLLESATALFWALGFTLALVYQVREVGLTSFELVLVGTAMELTCFVAEIPTGVVADLRSRRLSVLIGLALIGTALILQGAVPRFWAVLLAQVIWGLGYTFTSGATQAWITDEIGEDAVLPVFTRATQLALAATFVGTVLAGFVAVGGLGLPTVVAGFGYLATTAVLVIVMPENGFTPTAPADRETWSAVRGMLGDAVRQARGHRVVRAVLVVSLLVGLSSEAVDRLWVQHVAQTFTLPDVPLLSAGGPAAGAFTLFAVIGTLVSLLASLAANRFGERALANPHPNLLLAGLTGLQVAGIAGLALLGSLWPVMASLWVRDAARTIAEPVTAAWVNRNVEPASRATLLSVASQVNAIGEVVGGPPLGALASRRSIPSALVGSAVLLLPAAGVLARLTKR